MPVDISTLEVGYNPSPLGTINYMKNSGIIPTRQVYLKAMHGFKPGHGNIWVSQKPAWLTVIVNDYLPSPVNIDVVDYTFAINETVANNLGVGFYTGTVEIKAVSALGFGTIFTFTTTINLQVTEPAQLTLSPNIFNFQQTFGDPAPPAQFMELTADGSWSITGNQPWLSFSVNNGNGGQILSLAVDPSGLSPGMHHAEFVVNNGNQTKYGWVYFNITPSGTQLEHLSVSPNVLQFSANYQENATTEKTIDIDSSLAVDISTDAAWLSLSNASFPSGINSLEVSLQNTSVLPIGGHNAVITINASGIIKQVNVVLTIVEETSSGLGNGRFYFADARNRLEMTTGESNQEAVLRFTTTATTGVKKYERKIPYFLNALSVVIGLETSKLLKPNILPENLNTQFFVPLVPILMDLSIQDKKIGGSIALALQAARSRPSYSQMEFINGRNPLQALKSLFERHDILNHDDGNAGVISFFATNYRLSTLPKKQVLPKDGVVCFSFYSDRAIDNMTVVGNTAHAIIPVTVSHTKIYSAIVDLRNFGLKPNDFLTITCGIISTRIQIKDHDLPTTQLIWQNEWDCPEIFNCNGLVEIEEDEDSELVTLNRDGADYTEITEINRPRTFEVLTGKIYNDSEVAHLASIIRAKKVWIQIEDERFEVIPDFRSIKTMETRRFSREFKLKFNSAEK